MWLAASLLAWGWHLWGETARGLTDGAGHPFGDDALNFWTAARLAFGGHASEAYNLLGFHNVQLSVVGADLQLYHAGYPPVLMLLTWPLGWLPYLAFWAVWLFAGWLAFALCLRRVSQWGVLYAAAFPAVLVDFIGGQVGCWLAAIFGTGLALLPARPMLAGAVLSLALFKPQLAWMVPLALLCGGYRRAVAGFATGSAALLATTTLVFGPDTWMSYARQATVLRHTILEDGTGVWHRMISVFVLFRHAGAPVGTAYAAQAAVSVAVALAVCSVWRSSRPDTVKYAALVLGAVAASPYVSDYDLVMTAIVPVWLANTAQITPRAWRWASLLLVLAPIAAAPIATITGLAAGLALLMPALWLCIQPSAGTARAAKLRVAALSDTQPLCRPGRLP